MDAATDDEQGRQRMRAAWTGTRRRTTRHSGRAATDDEEGRYRMRAA
jgi:hypothetical protein